MVALFPTMLSTITWRFLSLLHPTHLNLQTRANSSFTPSRDPVVSSQDQQEHKPTRLGRPRLASYSTTATDSFLSNSRDALSPCDICTRIALKSNTEPRTDSRVQARSTRRGKCVSQPYTVPPVRSVDEPHHSLRQGTPAVSSTAVHVNQPRRKQAQDNSLPRNGHLDAMVSTHAVRQSNDDVMPVNRSGIMSSYSTHHSSEARQEGYPPSSEMDIAERDVVPAVSSNTRLAPESGRQLRVTRSSSKKYAAPVVQSASAPPLTAAFSANSVKLRSIDPAPITQSTTPSTASSQVNGGGYHGSAVLQSAPANCQEPSTSSREDNRQPREAVTVSVIQPPRISVASSQRTDGEQNVPTSASPMTQLAQENHELHGSAPSPNAPLSSTAPSLMTQLAQENHEVHVPASSSSTERAVGRITEYAYYPMPRDLINWERHLFRATMSFRDSLDHYMVGIQPYDIATPLYFMACLMVSEAETMMRMAAPWLRQYEDN
ncbi:hypothetical protein M422DRAFT_52636 [Sphaerobolus stellatus SS14]|uniref:Uncharacterized protein n=1 Tax=Sphaerobolus stellatus (strain SS14) TaxID=990650 RepID=A0A0C9V5W2_SPHS4|nr:hypothetical protein M422DRAFT_52636 [Sphaerobolus stellatus SS14]